MKKLIMMFALSLPLIEAKAAIFYGPDLCQYPQFECVKVESGQNWERLFPDETARDLVQRLNRTDNPLWPGKVIAVPKNLSKMTMFDLSPFPLSIQGETGKVIIVDQDKLAWGAYDEKGQLVKWGPISSGRDKCSDSNKSCRTMTGIFNVFSKENEKCKSNVFPIGKGGAKMPYCMYFHKGFALHGSDDIPGVRASHGCVRMFPRDAKWLNLEFVETMNPSQNRLGTKVIVRPIQISEKTS